MQMHSSLIDVMELGENWGPRVGWKRYEEYPGKRV